MDFIYFLGRFHVLALHLPIGIICVVVLMEFLGRSARFKSLLVSANYLWLVATIAAFGTVVLGIMHRAEGGFEGPAMASHAFWGIGTALLSLGILLFRRFAEKPYLKVQPILGAWMMLMVTMTGHYGGNLTHGSTYLLAYAPSSLQAMGGYEARKPVTDIRQAEVFLDVIDPVLQLRCSTCHNNDKFKGQLSLASYELMLTGGESGPAVVPGNIAESVLLQRINLAHNHDDFMPADGKTPLTEGQTSLINWWVEQGAPNESLLVDLNPPEEILLAAATFLGLIASDIDATTSAINVAAAAEADMIYARSLGFLIREMSQQSNLLEVDISVRGGELSDEHIKALNALAPQIYKLSLKNTSLNDQQFMALIDVPNLLILNLAETQLTDQSFERIQTFEGIEVLNIFANKNMTAEGLEAFMSTTNIQRVYSWGLDESL